MAQPDKGRSKSRVRNAGASGSAAGRAKSARAAGEDGARPSDPELLLDLYFSHVSIAFVVLSPELRFLKVNKAVCELLGYREKELLELDLISISHPEDAELTKGPMVQALRKGDHSYELEKRFLRKDGEVVWARLKATILVDEQKRPLYHLGVVEDITERRRSARELTEANVRFREVFENAPNGMALADLDGTVFDVNAALCAIRNSPREQLIGRTFAEASHPEDLDSGLDRLSQLREGKVGPYLIERRFVSPGGDTIWTLSSISLVRDDSGEPLYFIVQIQDISEQKRSERELAEANERFKEVFENAPSGIALMGLDGKILDVNPTLCTLSGYSHDELIGRSFAESSHPDDLEPGLERLQQLRQGKLDSYFVERRFIRRDGETIWTSSSISLVRDHEGEPLYFVAQLQDISEQKRAEQALVEANTRFRGAFEDAPIGMVMATLDNHVLDANPVLCAMLGWTREELLGKPIADITRPDDPVLSLEDVERLAEDGREVYGVEKRYLHADGHAIWARTSVAVIRGPAGEPLYMLGHAEDISERKRSEQALTEATQRFVAAFENAPIGMAIVDTAGIYLEVNPTLCRMLGYPRERLLEIDFQTITHPADRAVGAEYMREQLAGETSPLTFEKRYIHADGHEVWTRLLSTLVRDEQGEPLYFVTQIEDITERKRIEQQLAEASERFTNAFENAPIGMALTGPKGEWLQVNPALCHLLGYSEEQLRETTFQALTHPDDLAEGEASRQKFLAGEIEAFRQEKRYLHAEGHVVWARISVSLARNEQGEPLYFVTQVEDISERKHSEQALAEATQRFVNAFENTPIGMSVVDTDGHYLEVNPSLCRISGYSREQLLELDIRSFTHPEDRAADEENLRSQLAGEDPRGWFEKRYIHADGHEVWVRVLPSLVRDEQGEPLYFVTQIEDISERRRMEEEIRRSATLLEEAQRAAAVGSYEWNLATNEVSWSRQLYEIHGVDPPEFVPSIERSLDFVHPEDRGLVPDNLLDLFATSERLEVQYRIVRPDGSVRRIEVIANCERGEDGEPARVVGAVQDVTERVEAEATRRQLEAQMQEAQRLESLGVLAGGIAHDFNNLLVGVLGNAGLAATELPPGSPAKLLIDQIEIAARRAADLTKQMLAYSGRGQFVVRLLDLREVVRETAALLESAVSKNVRIIYEFADDVPAVRADVAQVRQLIMNLITNASDAIGEEPGEIAVRIDANQVIAAELATYSLSEGLPEATYVSIEVADTGSGMDAETLGKIFDPFFTTKFAGHGLGLAAALGIVRGHHGAIKVWSKPGKGSRFSLLFPAVEEAPATTPTSAADVSWQGSGTILVVDDEEIVRRAARRILSSGGLTVVEASSGQEALEIFRAEPDAYQLALVDLVMPGMSGVELMKDLHTLCPDLPVVLSSGYDARALAESASSDSNTSFLQKPYSARDLLNSVRNALSAD